MWMENKYKPAASHQIFSKLEKKLQTHTRTREKALMSCYLNLLPSSDPQWGLLFFLPLIYNPVSHRVMTSPRELDFINTHTSHWKQDEPLGHPGLHAASLPRGTLSSKKSLSVAMTKPPTSEALKAAWGDFCTTPAQGSLHPRVLMLHPLCTFLPRAPHSSALQDYLCCFLLAVQYIKSFRDWVEPELPPSLSPGSGWRAAVSMS